MTGRAVRPDARVVLVSSLLVILVFAAAVAPLAMLALEVVAPRLRFAARDETARGAGGRLAPDVELEVRRRLYGERRETQAVSKAARSPASTTKRHLALPGGA